MLHTLRLEQLEMMIVDLGTAKKLAVMPWLICPKSNLDRRIKGKRQIVRRTLADQRWTVAEDAELIRLCE